VVAAWPPAGPPAVLGSVDLTTFEGASVRAFTDLVVDPPGPVNAVTVTFRARLHDGIVHTLDPWKWGLATARRGVIICQQTCVLIVL
jgi:hypothetical protein